MAKPQIGCADPKRGFWSRYLLFYKYFDKIVFIKADLDIRLKRLMERNNFSKDEITVTGSASEIVTSDSGVWRFQIKAQAPTRGEAYRALTSQKPVVLAFLKNSGIKEAEIEFLGIMIMQDTKLRQTVFQPRKLLAITMNRL